MRRDVFNRQGALVSSVDSTTLAEAITQRVAEVEAMRETIYAAGFAYDFGAKTATLEDGTTATAGTRIMQIGTDLDRANWQAVSVVAGRYVDAGAGSEAMRVFRLADNSRVPMSATDALTATLALQAYAGAVLEASWDHKDAIRALETVAAVRAYDITADWPGGS